MVVVVVVTAAAAAAVIVVVRVTVPVAVVVPRVLVPENPAWVRRDRSRFEARPVGWLRYITFRFEATFFRFGQASTPGDA